MIISKTAEGILCDESKDDNFSTEDELIEFLLALLLFRCSGNRVQVSGLWLTKANEYVPDRARWPGA